MSYQNKILILTREQYQKYLKETAFKFCPYVYVKFEILNFDLI